MSAWPTVSMGEIFGIARGGSPRPIDDFITDDADGINWITIGDASDNSKYISHTKRRIKLSGVIRSRMVKPGDLLLTNSMSFGRPYIMQTSGCIHDGWLVLSPLHRSIHPDYFYYLLGSPQVYSEFERRAAGATVKNLNIDIVRSLKIPFPSLIEQRRIAAVLALADDLRSKRAASLVALSQLKESLFSNFLSAQADSSLPTIPLQDFCDIAVGYPFASKEYSENTGDIRLCRGANVLPGALDWSDVAYWPKSKAVGSSYLDLLERDIVIAMDRPWISSGFKVAMVRSDDLPALLVQRVARLRANSPVEAAFLYEVVRGAAFTRHCKPTETTVPHISPNEIRSFRLPQFSPSYLEAFYVRIEDIRRLELSFQKTPISYKKSFLVPAAERLLRRTNSSASRTRTRTSRVVHVPVRLPLC